VHLLTKLSHRSGDYSHTNVRAIDMNIRIYGAGLSAQTDENIYVLRSFRRRVKPSTIGHATPLRHYCGCSKLPVACLREHRPPQLQYRG
jgi:hypothetical protein